MKSTASRKPQSPRAPSFSSARRLAHDELASRGQRIVIHCKVGSRSVEAVRLALAAGYADVSSLDGGVLAWVREVDPTQPEY